MSDSDKKRRSGRSRDSESAESKPKKKKATQAEPSEKLLSPWGPLIWLLIPLISCIVYGVATRGH
ncbi:MAG: hypothetical protein IPI67_07080 [Myxococcales bacterium]|nr:hypothetical protein [Myxococcales bacterium]